jgi:hypothetical protein
MKMNKNLKNLIMGVITIFLLVSACGKSKGKKDKTEKKLSLEEYAMELSMDLNDEGKRKKAISKLSNLDWKKIGNEFPEDILKFWKKHMYNEKNIKLGWAVIKICGEIGSSNDYPCDNMLKVFITLTKKAVGTKNFDILSKRDRACGSLSSSLLNKMKKMKLCN